MKGRWEIDGNQLIYRLGRDELIRPSARDIWAAEFRGSRSVGDRTIGDAPSTDLPNLSLSRFAVETVLKVTGHGLANIRLEFGLRTDHEVVPLPASAGVAIPDQLIADAVWFPIDTEVIEATIENLRSRGFSCNQSISLGQLIKLRQITDLSVDLLDEAETDLMSAVYSREHTVSKIEGLSAQLYEYQSAGVAFISEIADEGLGCILGDEMGLGKTLQVIALFQIEKNSARGPNLVIVPATLLDNWCRELALFAPGLTVLKHAGATRFGIRDRLAPFDVVLCSYETAVRDEIMLSSIDWNILVLDEAQNIKNPSAQRTTSVKRFNRRVSIAVTGTPVENRLSDLWSLADFSLPGLLGGLSNFQTEFDDSSTDASRLAPIVAPILLRRKVCDVATDLPPRIDIPQAISMTSEMAAAYEGIRRETRDEYGNAATLVSLQRLRMFCAHPRLVGLWNELPPTAMPKLERLLEILEEVFSCNEKALVFTTYNGMIDIVLDQVRLHFPAAYLQSIDGRTPVTLRQRIVDGFTSHAGSGVLTLNPKAAGVGLNITAANHVVHYNPEWNPAVEDQASARAYRRKQTRPVTIHHLYLADSMEEVVIDRLRFKRDLAKEAVTGHRGDATSAEVMRALSISPLSGHRTIK